MGATMIKLTLSFCLLVICFTKTAFANIEVTFIEGAPKDTFVIKNIGNCPLTNLTVKIDLSHSAGKLIFDTTATGAGVEVFQPFEVTNGSITLSSNNNVDDGDSSLILNIKNLAIKNLASFTIDVDDTLPISELGKIRVAGSEIKNGLVKIQSGNKTLGQGVFGSDSKATIFNKMCS